jgi:hypothetical protein
VKLHDNVEIYYQMVFYKIYERLYHIAVYYVFTEQCKISGGEFEIVPREA